MGPLGGPGSGARTPQALLGRTDMGPQEEDSAIPVLGGSEEEGTGRGSRGDEGSHVTLHPHH